MDSLFSRRFISILLVILVVLNLALLGTLWWQNFFSPPAKEKVTSTYKYKNKQSFFEKELNLTQEQSQQFNSLRYQHFQTTLPTLVAISGLKRQLIQEAVKAAPDTQAIKILSGRIGRQQAIIEYRLAWHFNSLSKVCTPEQRDSLQQMLVTVSTTPNKLKQKLYLKRIRITPLQPKTTDQQKPKPEEQKEKIMQ